MPVFLFTDIEGSTRLWERFTTVMGKALALHDAILHEHIDRYGGRVIKSTGDGVFAIFEAGEPLQCAIDIQKQFSSVEWGEIKELRVRMAFHAGKAEKRGADYFGLVVNRAARILSTGWGNQILLTPEVMKYTKLSSLATLQDLGMYLLKDLSTPQRIYRLLHPSLITRQYPPLRASWHIPQQKRQTCQITIQYPLRASL